MGFLKSSFIFLNHLMGACDWLVSNIVPGVIRHLTKCFLHGLPGGFVHLDLFFKHWVYFMNS